MEPPNPSSLRFLLRPPSVPTSSNPNSQKPSSVNLGTPARSSTTSSSASSSSLPPSTSSSSPAQSPPLEGVVVVGFIGCRSTNTSQLINRILDANVFGSGNLAKDLASGLRNPHLEEKASPMQQRLPKIGYYYEEEKRVIFLQFEPSSPLSSITGGSSAPVIHGNEAGLYPVLEENDGDDLLGMLVMFSVCHTIIYLTEGSHFDTQILKNFRVLQAAKHALASFVKSHISPMLTSKAASLPTQSVQTSTSNASPPARGSSATGRHASAISLMSGSGSYPSLFPGQCSPAVLFVFLDDFSDFIVTGQHGADPGDAPSMEQPSILSGLPRSSLPSSASSSIVMLARSGGKTEGNFRKKLQSSLEAQVRFLIKKCRTLAGNDVSHSGSRGGTNMSSSPLFTLDASRAVVLLDGSINHKVESLEISMGIVDEIVNGNATTDMLLVENLCQNSNKEDIQSIKDFICRQCDSLRGRGGLGANTNSGSSSGVGMVAVAAAAAAASAASGKTYSAPELPDLEKWLSSSQLILKALLAAKRFLGENASGGRSLFQQNGHFIQIEGISPIGADVIGGAIACLERGRGLNMKFSTIWCRRALPDAKEIYLKDLPACYPTSHHEAQLGKALCAFRSMVKGPAVQEFVKRLEDECNLIWKSGRQLCDVISLTGKPCVHQRHDNGTDDLYSQDFSKPHSSGFVFLHACACGRSRQLREDPFDFKSANTIFNTFKCDQFLPTLQLPKAAKNAGPVLASSWSLVRLGNARYYDASKGMLQSGFCSTEKFLFQWTIPLQKHSKVDGSSTRVTWKELSVGLPADPKVACVTDESKNMGPSQLFSSQACNEPENQRKQLEKNSSNGPKISFGSGLPPFFMKRPFSEVVAGSVAVDSAFPPLQQKQEIATDLEKGVKQRDARDQIEDQISLRGNCQVSSKSYGTPHKENSDGIVITSKPDDNPFLQIGSNVVSVNVNGCANPKSSSSLKHAIAYVGFEHECPHGHRFLLSPKHLNELGLLYSLSEESCSKKVEELSNVSKNQSHEEVRTMHQPREKIITTKQHHSERRLFFRSEKQNQSTARLEGGPHIAPLDDDEYAYSLLNRNLPIYMNCPHCKVSKNKEHSHKFASTVSQLQRIFLVTPSLPVVLATSPAVQFEDSCLPPSVPDREQQSQFSPGHQVILPPESFLSFRLPFVYGVQLQDRSLHPLNHFEHQPELTAWIMKGTTLQLVSTGSNIDEECCI